MNVEQIRPYLLYEFKSDSELVKAINELSLKFTTKRESIQDYLCDEKLASAYVCFFLLTNIPKLQAAADKCMIEFDDYKNWQIIDIGCGPGTFSLALLENNLDLDLVLYDKSEIMLRQSRKIFEGLYPKLQPTFTAIEKEIPKKEKPRLGIFGHSANEIPVSEIVHLFDILDLDEILFIEPGTKDFFQKMLKIRTHLLDSYEQYYPCLGRSNCSMVDDWCHQYLHVSHATDVERISQLAGKDRRKLPIIIHWYGRDKKQKNPGQRIVRVFPKTKHSLEWQCCDSNQELMRFEIPTRNIKKQELKQWDKISAGDLVELEIKKELNADKKRASFIWKNDPK